MEDAMILNKASYERGFGHGCVYKCEVGAMICFRCWSSVQSILYVVIYFTAHKSTRTKCRERKGSANIW